MDFALTEEQKLLRSEARNFLAQEWSSLVLQRMLDDPKSSTGKFWTKVVKLGWPGLIIAEKFQGLASETFELAVLMEEMGRRLVPGTFFSSAVLTPAILTQLGSEDTKKRYLPAIAEGQIKTTVAIFEPDSGWDLTRLERPNIRGHLVKRFVPDANDADVLFCVVRQDDDTVRLVIPKQVDIQSLGSLDITRNLSQVTFKDPSSHTVGEGTLLCLQNALDLATIALAAEMVGAAAESLDVTVSYVKTRKQFGRPIGSFQAVQQQAANMLIAVEEARSVVQYASIVADEQPEHTAQAASMAKVIANQALRFTSQSAMQLHGGIGFTWEQNLHLYLKRAKASEFTLGNTQWHLDRITADLDL